MSGRIYPESRDYWHMGDMSNPPMGMEKDGSRARHSPLFYTGFVGDVSLVTGG